MSTFSINAAARAEIQRIVREHKCFEPVAHFYERADAGQLFGEFEAALGGGRATTEELSAIAKRRFEVSNQLESSLMVGVDERANYRAADLREVDGITFVLHAEVAEMLSEFHLTFANGRFLLIAPDASAHTLRSLVRTK